MTADAFGPYRLVSLLGAGGMGEVWRALDTRKDREIAVKVLGAWLGSDPDYGRRFRREAALAARLSAPNIIPIHDYGEIDGRFYIEMPLIAGRDLAAVLADEGPLPLARAAEIIGQIADALDVAHEAGMVHRDVKPSNVLISSRRGRDFIYLIDFGVAIAAGTTTITPAGGIVGSPKYMAPERFEDEGDHRGDVYALTCVFYEMLIGEPPFSAPPGAHSVGFYLNAHQRRPAPRPTQHRPEIPAAVDAVIARGMAKHPVDRYSSAGGLAAAVHDALIAAITQVVDSRSADIGPPPSPFALTADAANSSTTTSDTRSATINGALGATVAAPHDHPPATAPTVNPISADLSPSPHRNPTAPVPTDSRSSGVDPQSSLPEKSSPTVPTVDRDRSPAPFPAASRNHAPETPPPKNAATATRPSSPFPNPPRPQPDSRASPRRWWSLTLVGALLLVAMSLWLSGRTSSSPAITDRTLIGHTQPVYAVATAQLDGRPVVISGSADLTVRVWDLASGAPIGAAFTGHTQPVYAVATAQLDGRPVVISGSADNTVRVWDLASGAPIGAAFTGHTGPVYAVATVQLDGRPVAVSGSADQMVRVWDLATGAPVWAPLWGHFQPVYAVVTAQMDGHTVAISGSGGGRVLVWDLASGLQIQTPFTGHTGVVRALTTAQLDGRPVVVSGGYDSIVRAWDLASDDWIGSPLTVESVYAVAGVEVGGRLVVVSGGTGNTVRIWVLDARTRS
jgi:serine/threonine protein kinase